MYSAYDNRPNFRLTGSDMSGLPSNLDTINPQYYDAIAEFIEDKGGRLASVNGLILYDTVRMDAGVMPLKKFDFFQLGVGQTQQLFVAGTGYTKQEIDVHPWINNGRLDQGFEALIWGIQMRVQLVASLDESVQSSGNAINLPLVVGTIADEASATDPTKMGNIMRAVQESIYVEFKINDMPFERGPIYRFPTVLGTGNCQALANAGVGSTPARDAIADGMINNSMGWAYQMPVLRHIPAMTKFSMSMIVQNPFSTASNLPFRICAILEGIGISPVNG